MKNIQSHVVPTRRTNVNRDDITIIIMGANIGYGMKSYGPKCLLHINNHETLLEYQINLLRTTFPHADIILVVGFLADRSY
jgi:CTP:phosphocholine cytidylyltransferase-like protein